MPYGHLPPSGWAVAFIALAAAAMSVHNDMKGWQKGIWMLIIGAFLVTELRAINKDRHDSERQVNLDRQNQYTAFEGIRAAQNSEFTVTANGLNAAISGIDSTLKTANATLRQTAPHALFGEPHNDWGNAVFKPGQQFRYNVGIENIGNDDAKSLRVYSSMYFGAPNDPGTQQKLHLQFEEEWKSRKPARTGYISAGSPQFQTFTSPVFRIDDIQQISLSKLTIYTFTRISYVDRGGVWYSDTCNSLQVPLQSAGLPEIPCQVKYNNKRHRPNQW
jgi:hypothetical protein